MPVTNADLRKAYPYNRTIRGGATGNGGRLSWPLQVQVSGAPANLFAHLFQTHLAAGDSQLAKEFVMNLNADNISGQYPEHVLFRPPETVDVKYYTYVYLGTQDGTAATDIEATADKYGCGVIVSHPAPNSFVYDVLHADLASGANTIVKAGYRFQPDKRAVYGGVGEFENPALIIDTITGVVGTQVSFTTTTDATYTYTAGDIARTMPDLDAEELKAVVDNVDKTGLTTTTFDETGIIVYNKYSPRMVLTLEVETATTFSATVDVVGWPSSGSLGGGHLMSADFEPVNLDENYNGIMLKIPANAFGGTPVVGETAVISVYPSALAFWQRLEVLAGATPGDKIIKTGSGCQSV